jgi:hypothetical protein
VISGNKVNTAKRKRDDEVDKARDQNSKFIAEIIKLISHDKTWLIFKTIFLANGDSSEIPKAGMVKRQKRKYFVTAFGRVIFDSRRLLGTAIKKYWKLKALDSLGVADDSKMPKEQRYKIIEELIDNRQLKDISLSTKF